MKYSIRMRNCFSGLANVERSTMEVCMKITDNGFCCIAFIWKIFKLGFPSGIWQKKLRPSSSNLHTKNGGFPMSLRSFDSEVPILSDIEILCYIAHSYMQIFCVLYSVVRCYIHIKIEIVAINVKAKKSVQTT